MSDPSSGALFLTPDEYEVLVAVVRAVEAVLDLPADTVDPSFPLDGLDSIDLVEIAELTEQRLAGGGRAVRLDDAGLAGWPDVHAFVGNVLAQLDV